MQTELVERARSGDPEAFEKLVDRELNDLLRLATAIVLDRELARDVVQDSLLAAWRGLGSLRDPEAFDAWIRRIVVHRARNAVRRPRSIALATRELMDPNDRFLEDAIDLEQAMRSLSADARVTISLHYLDGLTTEEIAVLLGIPQGTVKSRLFEARTRLRAALGDSDG